MAAVIAHVTGTALAPGVSRNGRLYTRENIAKAVARGQARIADGKRPISMRTHHNSGDDSTHIVGRVTKLWQDPDTGSAKYIGGIADTAHGRDIAALTDDSDGMPQFLRGVSIRGAWAEEPRTETVDGRDVQTADDLEIAGLDFTAEPGVDDADVSHTREPTESEHVPFPIIESAPEALVSLAEAAEPLKSGQAATPQTKASNYADPGYQPDKMKRYALDSKTQAKAAWSFINQAKNAKNYTGPQLKRIKQRIKAALKKFGVEISADEGWVIDRTWLTESTELVEHYGEEYGGGRGSFCISLSNGPLNISISSYCVDPADLDLIGRAAMGAACDSLKSIDPDMDGDMDVPGADAEDTDGDMGEAGDKQMESATPARLAEAEPASPAAVVEAAAEAPAAEAEGAEDPDAETAPVSTTTAPEPVAEVNTETEEPVVTEPTTPAAENAPAATMPTAPAGITLTTEQFQMLLAAVQPPAAIPAATVESAPAAPVVEAQPVPAPVAPAAPQVVETQEQMIARMVQEGITTGIQSLVENGGIKAQRKGLAGRPVTETGETEGLTELGIPENWPQKPLHTYTAEERRMYIDRQWGEHVLGESYFTGKR